MCSSVLNLDVSIKAIIAEILRLFNKPIMLKDFIDEMKIINENQKSLHYTDYVIIKRHITNKSDFKEKIDKLKQHNHSIYKLVLKTCACLLSESNESNISVLNQSMENNSQQSQMSEKISQEDLKKLVDNKVQKPNTLIKNMDESISESSDDLKRNKFDSMQNILETLNTLELCFEKSPQLLLSDRLSDITLANRSFADQEQGLITDLIKLLTGLDGDFIWRDQDNFGQFQFCDGIKRNFLKIIDSILPLVVNYDRIEQFAKTQLLFKCGSVNNALADALLNILLVERIFINDIGREQMLGNFNIHNLWKKLTHLIDSSQFLSSIVDKHIKENAFGGKTLSILYDIIKSNNHNEQYFDVVLDLLKKSSAPYLEMLNGWLKNGTFFDPFMEFLVVDERGKKDVMLTMISSCHFDENRYSLRSKDEIPMFLHKCSEMILVAGKTRIILQKLHPIKKNDKLATIGINLKHNYYIDVIEGIYKKFNRELKDFIDNKSDFRQRLQVMKRFMLLERGDFIYQLLSDCEPFLSKEFSIRIMVKVQNVFESVKRSFSHFFPNNIKASDIELEFLNYDLNYELKKILELNSSAPEISFVSEETEEAHVMTGFDFVSLAVKVPWPFSIMFTPCIIENYKLLFRHLFYYKWIEYSLCGIWWIVINAKKKSNAKTIFYFRMISALRARMLSTIQIIQYYIMNEVIESHFKDFLKKLDDPNLCIDSMIEYHRKFISDCLLESMLIDKNIYGTMYKLLMLTRQFCEFVKKVDESDDDFSNLTFNYFTQSNEDSVNVGCSVNDTVEGFDFQYTLLILQLFDALRSTHNNKLICLITRIDLNSFYSNEGNSFSY